MAHILSIQSSARHEGSHSRALSAKLIAALNADGAHTVAERDLARPVPFIDTQWLNANSTPPGERIESHGETLGLSDTLIDELITADVLVIGVPIYNFTVPAALKAWIDQIARAGRTFRYTPNGPVGLLQNKKAYLVIASGGVPVDSAADFATPYLRHVLRFIGITDVDVVAADQLVTRADESLSRAQREIEALAA